ncbi:MAG: CoA-binding protein [Chloroflexota bacterium]|nr:CoA-binding protein [Chloroflexota bacterium]
MKDLGYFLEPKSVAVVGVSSSAFGFSWGRQVFENLVATNFPGAIYPVTKNAQEISGLKAYPDVQSIPDSVDIAAVAVPVDLVPQVIEDCRIKGVKGVILITAGYAETPQGVRLQQELTMTAKSSGMHIVGPNVSGIFNMSANFNVTPMNPQFVRDTPITVVSQGGYAINDLIYRGSDKNMGAGQYIHTGNEADLTCTDFVEFVGADPGVKVILMYIEGLRDGRRFIEVAKQVTQEKPIVVIKGGKTAAGAKAASSHTGALAGSDAIFDAALKRANVIRSPKIELMLDLGHAFLELPPLRGHRIAVATMGGSWGVLICDALNRNGLVVPELPPSVQDGLHKGGFPYWASTRNPIDLGAAGSALYGQRLSTLFDPVIGNESVDALFVHGFGMSGYMGNMTEDVLKYFRSEEEKMLRDVYSLMHKHDKPVILCSYLFQGSGDGYRIHHDVEDAATILGKLREYHSALNRDK